jgi:O-antigen/teichoic acid export membrane protein
MLIAGTFILNAAFNFALGILIARFLGPHAFGQYAIAAAAAVVLNTLMLDWVRLAATRFYSNRTRAEEPAVRGTLDALFGLSAAGLILVVGIAILMGADLELPVMLAALAPAMAICNGLFDYHSALTRARFEDRTYSLLVVLKNLLALVLMVGGAWWLQSATVVAAGLVLSLLATLLAARRRLVDPGVQVLRPDWPSARRYFLYGFPVIAAAAIYFLIALWNRTAIAVSLGFGPSGEFSLAYDLAVRVVQTVGSAVDIILFQLAVRAEEEHGPEAAREQLARNMALVLAAVLAVSTGYWLVLPSFEALLVPQAFRQSFTTLTLILLPGLVCFALVQAAVTPVFQLKRITWPAIVGAVAALVANVALVGAAATPSTAAFAVAQALSYGLALAIVAFLSYRAMAVVPPARDVAAALLATVAMMAVVWPIRALGPGWTTLLLSVAAGAATFAIIICTANVGRIRTLARRTPSP